MAVWRASRSLGQPLNRTRKRGSSTRLFILCSLISCQTSLYHHICQRCEVHAGLTYLGSLPHYATTPNACNRRSRSLVHNHCAIMTPVLLNLGFDQLPTSSSLPTTVDGADQDQAKPDRRFVATAEARQEWVATAVARQVWVATAEARQEEMALQPEPGRQEWVGRRS